MAVIKIIPFPGPKGDSSISDLSTNSIAGTTWSEPYNLQLSDANKFFIIEDGSQPYININPDATTNFTVGTSFVFNVINSSLYIFTQVPETVSVYATGQSASNYWYVNAGTTGVYTLTKIASNKWILDGQGVFQD